MADEAFTPESPRDRQRRRGGEGGDCSRWIPAVPEGASIAREHVRSALRHWRLDEHSVERAALLVSELVTNAIVHGARHRGSPPRLVWCHIQRTTDTVRLSVWGPPGTTVPSPRRSPEVSPGEVRALPESGRGLLIVAAMSRAWGTRMGRVNRLVWAEL
ncbi:ATP-binding protein [Streptomyces sp. 71268]|uniref:ATP-binding protein n=1 Tax=Streptomyces sp. 71268 TaxID=3002640 RepID=UPI0023FA362B|nr:ATP-binding protein [Streptomyces sp. 71268]WEV29268.1 ATP-binding protein [Streptomyces sp. 71268]